MVQRNQIPSPIRKLLDGARGFAKVGHGFPFSFYESADTLFWPGCGLAANRPGLVRKVRKILSRQLQKRVGLALDCCYAPVIDFGDTETTFAALQDIHKRLHDHGVRQVITGCLNCHKLLSKHLQDIRVVYILEALPPEIFEKQQMESIYLHHPCPSSGWETIRNHAKGLVSHIHASSQGIYEASTAYCCGAGCGLSASYPDLSNRFLDRIAAETVKKKMVTYCTGCQNRFLKRGIEAVHLLECLPGVNPRREIPSPLRQWTSRLVLAMVERLKTGKFPTALIIVLLLIGGAYVDQKNILSTLLPVLHRPLFRKNRKECIIRRNNLNPDKELQR
jgi:Cysteine-rich domain